MDFLIQFGEFCLQIFQDSPCNAIEDIEGIEEKSFVSMFSMHSMAIFLDASSANPSRVGKAFPVAKSYSRKINFP